MGRQLCSQQGQPAEGGGALSALRLSVLSSPQPHQEGSGLGRPYRGWQSAPQHLGSDVGCGEHPSLHTASWMDPKALG